MGRPGLVCLSRGTMLFMAAYLGTAVTGITQETPSPSPAPAALVKTNDSLEEFKAQVRELAKALIEMRDQVTISRRETQELRRELQVAREQLASFQRELAESASQVAAKPSDGAFEYSTQSEPVQPKEGLPSEGVTKPDNQVGNLEEEQRLLSAKVEDQYQTKVESGSKYRVRLSGIALLNIFGTRGSVDNMDLPAIAQPRGPLDSSGSFGATVRQSMLGLEVLGPTVGGAKTSGDLQFDFFGGFPYTADGVTAGLVRLRTARVSLDWTHTSIVAGQDAPFFSPLSPSSLASLAYPAFSYSGNLWTWTPQLRLERRVPLSDESSIIVQGGILDALTGELPGDQSYRMPQAGERAHGPAYATRTAWTHAAYGRLLTVGAGAYYARQNWGFSRMVDAWAATADWDLPLGRWFSLTGEFYRGRAIGGLGASTGRSVLYSGPLMEPTTSVLGLDSSGGWSQLKFKPLEKLEFNGAFGEDYPFASDLGRFYHAQSYVYSSVGRNASAFFNVIYHARSNLLLSVEYRRLWTSESYGAKPTADHVNFSAGVLF